MNQQDQKIMVSICCITYNQESYIQEALDGFLNQKTDFLYEILIHDDASTDGTADIIRTYADRYPDVVKPILQTKNQYSGGLTNISGTYNFPRAAGRYIAMCEGDDYWTDPLKLKRQVDYMEAHRDCALCFHSARVRVVGRAVTERSMRPYGKTRVVSPKEIIDKQTGYPTASLLFRAELVKRLPEFYVDAPIADIPLQLLAASKGYGYYMDRSMCVYRLGGAVSWTSMMKQGDYESKQKRYYEQMKAMYRGFDEYSEGRFREVTERAVSRLYYLTQVNTKHYDTVLSPRYRQFYRELSLRTRFFIRLETKAPGLYDSLFKLLHRTKEGDVSG